MKAALAYKQSKTSNPKEKKSSIYFLPLLSSTFHYFLKSRSVSPNSLIGIWCSTNTKLDQTSKCTKFIDKVGPPAPPGTASVPQFNCFGNQGAALICWGRDTLGENCPRAHEGSLTGEGLVIAWRSQTNISGRIHLMVLILYLIPSFEDFNNRYVFLKLRYMDIKHCISFRGTTEWFDICI